MDDGAYTPSGFYLHTKGFTFNEVYMLAGILHYNFGITVNVQSHSNTPVIYVTAKSLARFTEIVKPHFHPQLLYKLTQ